MLGMGQLLLLRPLLLQRPVITYDDDSPIVIRREMTGTGRVSQ